MAGFPGDLIRIREGQQVTIDVINETDASDIVHWHGLHIPSLQDGATEEGSPELAPHGGTQRYTWVAKPGRLPLVSLAYVCWPRSQSRHVLR